MKLIKTLEQLEKKYSVDKDKYSCRGGHSRFYRVEDGKIAKILFDGPKDSLMNDRDAISKLFKIYNDQELAREFGINYPKIEGLYAIKENSNGLYFPGLVMKDVGDKTIDSLCGKDHDEFLTASRLWEAETQKANEAGITIHDNHPKNAMWFENQTYLVDGENIRFNF
jgi:hypothetical protein